jgi:hypothetical protein
MKLSAVHHGYPEGTPASGHVAAGGEVRFAWDGGQWQPLGGRNPIAQAMGALDDVELRARIHPDPSTVIRLGGHWRAETTAKDFEFYAA